MYVYVQSEPGLYTVGHYAPDGQWVPESDHDSKDKAAVRAHWLNGGNLDEYRNPVPPLRGTVAEWNEQARDL